MYLGSEGEQSRLWDIGFISGKRKQCFLLSPRHQWGINSNTIFISGGSCKSEVRKKYNCIHAGYEISPTLGELEEGARKKAWEGINLI